MVTAEANSRPLCTTVEISVPRINKAVMLLPDSKLISSLENWVHTFQLQLPFYGCAIIMPSSSGDDSSYFLISYNKDYDVNDTQIVSYVSVNKVTRSIKFSIQNTCFSDPREIFMLCSLVHVSTNNFLISLSEILTCQHVCNFSTFEPTNRLHTLNYHLFQPIMINLTNKNVYDVKQLVEPPRHELIAFSNSWAVTTLATMDVTATVLSIVSFSQFKHMHIQLFILHLIAKANSENLPSFIYHTETTTDVNGLFSLEDAILSEISWVHGIFAFLIILVIIQCIIIVCLWRKRPSKHTVLNLELTSGADCVIIPLIKLPLCPSYYTFKHPYIRDIGVSDFPSNRLIADWSPFVVKDNQSSKTVSIPNQISVNYFTHKKLVKILKQPYCAYLYVHHQGFSTLVPQTYDADDILEL